MTGSGGAFAPFRPRRGRAVATTAAVIVVLVFAVVAFFLPGPHDAGNWTPFDRVMLIGLALAIAWFLLRYASIKALPTRETLTVRNLLSTRSVEWSQIVAVQFAGADPWVTLDLADTDSLAVMAIQKADGPRSRHEAARLAALVAGLGEAGEAGVRGEVS
ncbi:MAG: PH domain-containing protein [Nostocoides sp.]